MDVKTPASATNLPHKTACSKGSGWLDMKLMKLHNAEAMRNTTRGFFSLSDPNKMTIEAIRMQITKTIACIMEYEVIVIIFNNY